jgi:hypothetical protein
MKPVLTVRVNSVHEAPLVRDRPVDRGSWQRTDRGTIQSHVK